jgi:hypothetical protein
MKFYIFLIAILFVSCNSQDSDNKKQQVSTDSSFISTKTAATFDDKLFKLLSLPLSIDTTFIIKLDTNDRIPFEQLRALRAQFLDNELSNSIAYNINTFCEIDSLKQIGEYKKYVDSLTIGMTKISIGYKIGCIDFKNNSKLFIWGLTSSSYEACPFYNGTLVIGTFVNEARQNTHFLLGEISGFGDPPSMGNSELTAKINSDGKIEIKSILISDDLDVPGEETTKRTLILQLDKDKIQVLDTKKEVKNTEKVERQ